ncbi:GNAT family N-acetyltransferase [Bradyrhizobium sp. 164]|uniref:GNAT family N-acetyltransferase n=1 Tax=Bradyrhizobium sp. 164 TaxID=2782637 RepID=UPI0032085129
MAVGAQGFSLRKATDNDHTDILAVLEQVAPQIPVSLEGSQRQDAIKQIIIECCASGESLVACDEQGAVVGFVLAKPDRGERFFRDNGACSLRYIGVASAAQGRGIFSAMLKEMKAAGEPLTAEVLNGNQAGMADRLKRAGFVETKSDEREKAFRWECSDARGAD